MSQFFIIHPDNPQPRLIKRAAEIVREGGLIIYPTDSAYALGCHMGDKAALERINNIRQLDKNHAFTLACANLSSIATYAKVSNTYYRLLKANTPGPYTFILPATSEVPRRLLHPKRKTIGIRVPGNPIALALLAELAEPLMSTTLILAGQNEPLSDPEEIRDRLEKQVELVIEGGYGSQEETTVIDMTGDYPELIRRGCGDPTPFM